MPMDPSRRLRPSTTAVPVATAGRTGSTDGESRMIKRDARSLVRHVAFVLARGHYGNSGRNILCAPGLTSLDFAVFKNFPIRRKQEIQFRWENYNFTNTPPFNPPTLEISSGNFGRITSAGLGREMQFACASSFEDAADYHYFL